MEPDIIMKLPVITISMYLAAEAVFLWIDITHSSHTMIKQLLAICAFGIAAIAQKAFSIYFDLQNILYFGALIVFALVRVRVQRETTMKLMHQINSGKVEKADTLLKWVCVGVLGLVLQSQYDLITDVARLISHLSSLVPYPMPIPLV